MDMRKVKLIFLIVALILFLVGDVLVDANCNGMTCPICKIGILVFVRVENVMGNMY
jgi:hypothetical protein